MSSLVGMKRSRPEQEAVSADDDGYTGYLAHLRALISVRTVTSDSDATHRGIEHCRLLFASALEPLGWLVRTDCAGNLQCVPPLSSFDYCQRVLWLCAHIDTVDASASDFGGCDPFVCSESPTHLTGRGANDCKAGVAFMLWYAERMAAGLLPLFNGGFLVTRQEEAGPLARSAPQFALDMASGDLPISSERRGTFVMILENTVSLARTVRQRGMQHRGQQRGQRAVAAAAVAGDATESATHCLSCAPAAFVSSATLCSAFRSGMTGRRLRSGRWLRRSRRAGARGGRAAALAMVARAARAASRCGALSWRKH
jgi:acetylornithine deacetylase/succinyl-diaminopimelate desuccinylase-like protein